MNFIDILLAKKINGGGGGGGSATLIDKNISANGTYNASTDNADGYKKVVVNVPNPSTGSLSITSNNTYDVTNYASAVVNVPNPSTGSLSISANGTYDVTNYASADVDVPTEVDYAPSLLMNTLTEYSSGEVTSLRASSFAYATKIVTLNLPNCLSINGDSISHMDLLEHLYLPKCTTFNGMCLSYNSKLTVLALPAITSNIASYGFRSNGFATLDLGESFGGLASGNGFNACSKLINLIIRKASVADLPQINAFSSTPFASGGTGGTLYVPQALISSYQSATNWSTILGYANNQIKSIESTHTDPTAPIDLTLYYADGTPIGA